MAGRAALVGGGYRSDGVGPAGDWHESYCSPLVPFLCACHVGGPCRRLLFPEARTRVGRIPLFVIDAPQAGTGKSFLLKHLIKLLSEEYGEELVITSYTGRTAINIRGKTLHSFAGIGVVGEVD